MGSSRLDKKVLDLSSFWRDIKALPSGVEIPQSSSEEVASYQTSHQTAEVSLPGYTRYKRPDNKKDENHNP